MADARRGHANPGGDVEGGSWDDYLDPGEKLLWTGRPGGGLRVRRGDWIQSAFGLMFLAFSIFWEVQAYTSGAPTFFMAWGAVFVLIGAYLCFGRYLWDAFVRARTRYALTERRALIATNVRERRMLSYPIEPSTPLELLDSWEGTVNFATRRVRSRNGMRDVPVGFEFIRDARELHARMREIQRAAKEAG